MLGKTYNCYKCFHLNLHYVIDVHCKKINNLTNCLTNIHFLLNVILICKLFAILGLERTLSSTIIAKHVKI